MQHHEDDQQAKPADSDDKAAKPVDPAADAQAVAVAAVVEAPVELKPQTPATTQAGPAQVAEQPQVPVQPPVDPKLQTQPQTPVASAQPVAPKAQEQAPAAPATPAVADAAPVAADAQAAAVVDQKPQAEAKPADRPVQTATVAPAKPKHEGDSGTAQQQSQQPQQDTLPQPGAEQARTVAQAYGRTAHTSNEVPTTAQSGTPAASPVTPVTGGQPAAARGELAPATPVPLARAAETVEHVMRLASGRGVTQARISLTPESLGSIDLHLRHTADGMVAKLVAHSPEAVQHLQQAAADLRQQLEGQGVNLLSLDIGQSNPDQGSAAQAQADLGDGDRADGRGLANGGDAAGEDADATVNSTLQLPNGVLVDVLA